MEKFLTKLIQLSFIFILLLGAPLLAADFFVTKTDIWFDVADKTPVSVTVELTQVSLEVVKASAAEMRELNGKLSFSQAVVRNENAVTITGKNIFHRDILKINGLIQKLQSQGAKSVSPEIPLAVRVTGLKNHDDFLSQISGIRKKSTIKRIDSRQISNKPLIFRYYLDDRFKISPKQYMHMMPYQGDAIVGFIPANTYGQMPLSIPGESVVFHARTFHGASVLGKYNPGLINLNIVLALTANKYVEALFWNEYAPDAIPTTELLANMKLNLKDVGELKKSLDRRYPEGWVLKGVAESNSNFSIVTDKTDLQNAVEKYKRGDFEAFKKKTYEQVAGMDEDELFGALQEHPDFLGWKITQYLDNPTTAIVQKKVDIDREFRVEAIGGRVLSNGSTIDRHNWLLEIQGKPFQVSRPEVIGAVEAFTQALLDRLPAELKETHFAFDIATLKNGGFAVIESNPGSESGFLIDEESSVVALNDYLRTYPDLVKKGLVRGKGLTPEEEMTYLAKKFKQWSIDPKVHYKTFTFLKDKIDNHFKSVEVKKDFKIADCSVTLNTLAGK